jgi:hypothetical protein
MNLDHGVEPWKKESKWDKYKNLRCAVCGRQEDELDAAEKTLDGAIAAAEEFTATLEVGGQEFAEWACGELYVRWRRAASYGEGDPTSYWLGWMAARGAAGLDVPNDVAMREHAWKNKLHENWTQKAIDTLLRQSAPQQVGGATHPHRTMAAGLFATSV